MTSRSLAPSVIALALLAACGSDSEKPKAPVQSGFGGHSGTFDGGAQGGASGSGSGGGQSHGPDGSADSCPSLSFSLAPVPCSNTITNAKIAYPLPCDDPKAKGWLATCAPYDAVIAPDGSAMAYCFYAKQTGNLIGAVTATGGVREKCLSFDLDFTAPDIATCAPVVPGTCPK